MFAVHSKKHVTQDVIPMMKSQTGGVYMTAEKTEELLADQ